jgi:peptidoglycan LD-endopeptidase CwlK
MALDKLAEKKLARVKADLVSVVRRASEISSRPFTVVQGNRTQIEQNALYAQGRTKPGNIVTWTKKSKHIGGNAVDLAALVNGKISWDTKYYPPIIDAMKKAARELKVGIEAGIDWKTKDWGHIQLAPVSPTPTRPTAGLGWTISDVQNALIKHGFDPGLVDGILGKKTRGALSQFQKIKGLEQTGAPDKLTTDQLALPPETIGKMVGLVNLTTEVGSPRWAVNQLMQRGLSREDAIIITANLIWESGGRGSINWSAHGDGDHSKGAAQWNDRHGRFQGLEALAEERGTSWHDPETQIQFLVNELATTEHGTLNKLNKATTLPEKMKAALTFWRPGIPHEDKRLAIAEKLNKEIKDVRDDDRISTSTSDDSPAS